MILSLDVDDLLAAGNSMSPVNKLKKELSSQYEREDCGEVKVCIGLVILRDRSKRVVSIAPQKYTHKILDRFGMAECKSTPTRKDPQIEKEALDLEPFDSTIHRQAIGSLIFLMIYTKPDITFAV